MVQLMSGERLGREFDLSNQLVKTVQAHGGSCTFHSDIPKPGDKDTGRQTQLLSPPCKHLNLCVRAAIFLRVESVAGCNDAAIFRRINKPYRRAALLSRSQQRFNATSYFGRDLRKVN